MKTSTVLKKARKLIEKPENWLGSEFNKPTPDTETYTFMGAIEQIAGEYYYDTTLYLQEKNLLHNFECRMWTYDHQSALRIMDKLIELAIERGV